MFAICKQNIKIILPREVGTTLIYNFVVSKLLIPNDSNSIYDENAIKNSGGCFVNFPASMCSEHLMIP